MPDHPITKVVDELTKQAVMRFRPEDVSRVHRVCTDVVRGSRITVEMPLPCWDSQEMGVAFRRTGRETINGKSHRLKRTASFTLSDAELAVEDDIRAKAEIARDALNNNVLSSVREVRVKPPTVEASPPLGDPVTVPEHAETDDAA